MLDIEELDIEALRAYMREGSYAEAAKSLGIHPQLLKRRLMRLYAAAGAKNATQAVYLLRDRL